MSDPIGYEFGGSDEGSHYMNSKQGHGESDPHLDSCRCSQCAERDLKKHVAAGPKPNPSAAGLAARRTMAPTVRVVQPIEALLDDVRNLTKAGLDYLKTKGGQFTPMDARTLECLARTAKLAQDMDAAVKAELGPKLARATEDSLKQLAEQLGVSTNAGSD